MDDVKMLGELVLEYRDKKNKLDLTESHLRRISRDLGIASKALWDDPKSFNMRLSENEEIATLVGEYRILHGTVADLHDELVKLRILDSGKPF